MISQTLIDVGLLVAGVGLLWKGADWVVHSACGLAHRFGLPDAVVGVSEHSDYPEAARSIARVGGGSGLDLEAILALRPDLVIAWGSGSPPGQLQQLRRLGLPVFVSEPGRVPVQMVADDLEVPLPPHADPPHARRLPQAPL